MGRSGVVKFLCMLVILNLTSACSAASSQSKYGPYRGQVLDWETNKPVLGVAVLAIWWEAVFNPVQGKQEFYDAKEAVTGADGRFEISKLDVPLWKLGVQPAEILFFAPGYLHNDATTTRPSGELFVDPTIIKLQPAKTKQERMDFQRRVYPHIPQEKMPVYLRTINQELIYLGLKPLGK